MEINYDKLLDDWAEIILDKANKAEYSYLAKLFIPNINLYIMF